MPKPKWPTWGYVPCVHCKHLRGEHSKQGKCVIEGCDCSAFLSAALAEGTLIVTPEQLRDGYRHRPYVRLGSNIIETERADYTVVSRLDDGNYLVEDPRNP